MNTKEIFKDIPGYEGYYQVSTLGNVKSLKYGKERILKDRINSTKYLNVILYKNKICKSFKNHQLVAMAFLNHKPNGYELIVDHINNVRTDNRVENLQLITPRENVSKDIRNGTSKYIGVSWSKKSNKWLSRIKINYKIKHLGYFIEEYEAHLAYQNELKNIQNGI